MTDSRTTQIGIESWVSDSPNERTSQIGAEAWWTIGTVFQCSQIGVEVWRSVANATVPGQGGFNMPMPGL